MPKWIILWTDIALYVFFLMLLVLCWYIVRRPHLYEPWKKVWHARSAVVSTVLLGFFLSIAFLDSIHYRPVLRDAQAQIQTNASGQILYQPITLSVLDALLSDMRTQKEVSYSAPFAQHLFTKKSMTIAEEVVRDYPRLTYGGAHLSPSSHHLADVLWVSLLGLSMGGIGFIGFFLLCVLVSSITQRRSLQQTLSLFWVHSAQRAAWGTTAVLCLLVVWAGVCSQYYHVFGTDATGNSVLYQAVKGVRTAMVIGILATLVSVPLAIIMGLLAGYYRRWVDDVIQYIYSLISSVPTVLLMAASVLMLQVYLDQRTSEYATGLERADARLFAICGIIGLTAWVGLCRLLRAETMKLREMEYVKAAQAFSVPTWKILWHHILPNLMHLVLVVSVLEFSGLVLFEAVLSYLGIGVDPQMYSFGSMINIARIEVLRDPMIWWNISAAFLFLLAIVLSANILADHVRRAFDPRAQHYRATWLGRRLYTKKIPQVQPPMTQHSCG